MLIFMPPISIDHRPEHSAPAVEFVTRAARRKGATDGARVAHDGFELRTALLRMQRSNACYSPTLAIVGRLR
jgi:hypothetical protein